MKLPPETPVMMSTSSSIRVFLPPTVNSVSRSASSAPNAKAAARVPPPENATTINVSDTSPRMWWPPGR